MSTWINNRLRLEVRTFRERSEYPKVPHSDPPSAADTLAEWSCGYTQ